MVDGVDYLAGGSHKALCCPEAAGFLLVAPDACQGWQARLASWLSLPEPVDFLVDGVFGGLENEREPRENDPSTLEGSSLNTLAYHALSASIRHLDSLGLEGIHERIQGLQNLLEAPMKKKGWKSLRAQEEQNRSAILSFLPPEGTRVLEVASRFAEANISVGTPNGCLRFGFHTFSKTSEVKRVLSVL